MKPEQFRQILREEIEECLIEILPVIVKQVLKEQLTPVLKAMINERKKAGPQSSYIGEIKKSTLGRNVEMQPASHPSSSTATNRVNPLTAPINSKDPLKNMLAETFNSMLPDEYEDYEVPEAQAPGAPQMVPVDYKPAPGQKRPAFEAPQLQMESAGQQMPELKAVAPQGKSVISTLVSKLPTNIPAADYYPEADLENIKIDNVPDYTALMAKRTFK
jgi:hypothetical protein